MHSLLILSYPQTPYFCGMGVPSNLPIPKQQIWNYISRYFQHFSTILWVYKVLIYAIYPNTFFYYLFRLLLFTFPLLWSKISPTKNKQRRSNYLQTHINPISKTGNTNQKHSEANRLSARRRTLLCFEWQVSKMVPSTKQYLYLYSQTQSNHGRATGTQKISSCTFGWFNAREASPSTLLKKTPRLL